MSSKIYKNGLRNGLQKEIIKGNRPFINLQLAKMFSSLYKDYCQEISSLTGKSVDEIAARINLFDETSKPQDNL